MPSRHEGTAAPLPITDPGPPHSHSGAGTVVPDLPVVLRELAWLIHRSAPARSGAPLPTTEIALLKQVVDAPGSTIGELAAALGARQPNVSTGVRSLEQRGFVRRVKSVADRRVTQIVATEIGAAEHSEISEAWTEPVRAAVASLPEAQQRTLGDAASVLQELHEQLRTSL